MAVRRSLFWAVVLLLASLDLWCSSSSPPCPESCVCRGVLLMNCSSAGLSSVPQPVQDPITELDLSHNLLSSVTFHQPHPNLRNLWLGNNSIQHLSLCIERTVTARRLGRRSAAGSGSRCLSWAPALQLLSAERNLLERLPRGLDAVESLLVLELSFNRISSLEPGVLGVLHQLRELHLQHNLITHLDPQMFQKLEQLKVLDLRFNMLTTMQQLTYLTLRDIGADVKLGGNRWRCDCNMRSIRRQMAYDSTRGIQTWNIICSEPSTISGKDLLHLDEEDLTCLSSENNLNFHRDVTVYSGAEILLSCSAQESEWWTPDGRASVSQQGDRLLVSDFSEGDAGLYVCVSEEDHIQSVFNLQISKMRGARQERSVPGVRSQTPRNGTVGETAGGFTQSDMALAVCLSIFFTFLLAFILGVLARPCIDRLWRRVSKKKDSPATHTVISAQQRHYDNQAFSNAEEPEEIGPHRERRVTFSRIEVTEESNVQYYDTVASGDQQSIRSDEVFEYQEVEVDLHRRPREKQSDDNSSVELAAERLRNMKFEPIPDPDELEERRSLSSSSDSSQSASESDQITRKHTMPKSLQLVEDSFETRAGLPIATKTKTSQISTKGKSEYPGSSALHTNKANTTDSDISQGNEELFEFSDGAQSPSAKNSYDTKSPGDVPEYSSSASSDSSDSNRKPVQIKIKQKTKKKQKKVAQKSKPGTSSSSSHSESEEKMTYVDGRGRINTQQLPLQESKTKIDDSDERWPAVDLQHIPRLKRRLDIKALLPSSDSSFSSESEDEPRSHVTKNTQDGLMIARRPTNESQKVSPKPRNQLPGFEFRKTSANKRPLDIKVPTAGSNSSTSSDSDDKTTCLTVKKPGRLDVAHLSFQKSFPNDPADSTSSSSSDTEDQEKGNMLKQRKENLSKIQTKVSPTLSPKQDRVSNSSSSSDSDHDMKDHIKQEEVLISKFPTKVTQTVTQKAPSQWPSIDLGRVARLKRRLDIKAPKAHSDSSSRSDSENEARDQLMTQNQKGLLMSRLPGKVSSKVHPKPENRWSAPELGKTTQIKKLVDIKASSTDSDSSSSSDSDNERKDQITQNKQKDLYISQKYITPSTQKPENQWPTLDFGRGIRIKRRLDIKAPTADSESSSSSDSEDETRGHAMKQKQEELLMSKLPSKVYPTLLPKPENRWSVPDLGKTTQIKKPVDIKASSTDSDSSSSSCSDNERRYQITQNNQEVLYISKPPTNVTTVTLKPANQWPTLDFDRVKRIKRRLDIKAYTADSDSFSSSDSEDETRGHLMKQKQEELVISQLPGKVPPTVRPKSENRWSAPDLGRTTQIKRPVDNKASSTNSDSSSSSDSGGDTKHHITQKKQEKIYISKLPVNVTTSTEKPANQWPTLDFGRVTKIKRRLDIKAPTADSESSSSSDSEDETKGHAMKQKEEELLMSKLPSKVYPTVHPKPENRWSAPDLGKTTQIKKPVDIKASSTDSDSSSSSDSDNEKKDQITQKKQEELYVSKLPTNVTTSTQNPAGQWPSLDFGRMTRIKRRLDIKAPTADSESSFSSDSEDETKGHAMKQKEEELLMSKLPSKVYPTVYHTKPENRWSVPDLGKTTQIKKPVDIKASSTDSDSSSSSYSDNERTNQITQNKQEVLYISKPPTNVTTVTLKPANQWPTLDFDRVKQIKRRLDIKAPTADSDSSSSSDSEDETRSHVMKQKQEELVISQLPGKVPPTVHPKSENRWSAPDLGKTTQTKKPLDNKASSPDSDSSTSSDSGDDTKHYITQKKQENIHISKLPVNVTISTEKPANQWPTLDFGRVTKIKRRLDIKAPTAESESSSSSDSEDETRGHAMKQKEEELLMSKVPSKVYPIVHPKPENRWSASDLGKTAQIKKPVHIKVLSTDSDSSSSSDSDNKRKDQVTQKKHEELYVSKLPTNVTTSTQKPAGQWPSLDFGRMTRIKRRLDIKGPTADKDSSSSSDSEDETRGHVMKQKEEELLMSKLPSRVYPTVHPKPENHWSVPDLGNTTQIKKPVDIKASSADSDSSSSSYSDNERKDQITQKKQEELYISKLPTNVTTVTQKPANQWPTLDFDRVKRIKRRLDIKAHTADSDSSSSEDETKDHVIKQEESLISQLLGKVRPIVHPKPENHWSAPDLGKTKEFKNPLDTMAQSTDSDSFSSGDSDNEKDKLTKLKQEDLLLSKQPVQTSQKASQKQGNQWPSLDLWKIRQFKRRLDIKSPAADSNSSSSSDSEDETSGHVIQQKQEELRMSTSFTKMSAKVKLENHWPSSVLGKTDIKSPLDIKVPSPSSDSSSSSEGETRGHMKTQKQEESLILRNPADITQSLRSNSENQWPTLDLGQIPSIRRRLDIKTAIPHESLWKVDRERNLEGVNPSLTRQVDNKASSPLLQLGLSSKSLGFKKSESQSTSNEGEDENRDQKAKIRKDQSFTSTASEKFIKLQIAPGINIPYDPKTDHNIKLEKYTDISGDLEDMPTNDARRTTLEVDPELQSRWATMNLGVSRFRKHLEISSNVTESDLNSPPDSPFSGSESGSVRRQRLRRRFVGIQETTHESSSPGLENFQLNMSPTPKSPEDKFTFSDIVKQRINKNHSDKDSTSPSKQSSNSPSSSDGEDETKDHSVTDLSRGVPLIKRRFDIKTPAPEPSNTPPFIIQTEDFTKQNAVQSTQASTIVGPTDESLITYKRSIFKSLSLPSSSFTPNGSSQTVDHIPNLSKDESNDKDTSLVSKATKSTSFDDIIKRRLRQSRSKTDGDLMEKIKWTRVGHHLPDLSSSKSGEGLNVTSKSLPQASFTELTSPSNDSASSTTAFSILQLSKKSDATQTHKYSSLGPEVTPSPSGDVLHVLGNSSQRTPEMQRVALGGKSERKGLSALKAMSRERKNWEWDEDTHLVFDTQDGNISSHSQSEKDTVLSRQSQIHSPSASESKKDIDLLLLYGVPRYKRHSIGDSLTEASLPGPASPQQDD